MKLYQGNAKDLIGKHIDCYVRRFGYYPMKIIVSKSDNKTLLVKDAVGVCMPIPEKETDFNCHYFDFVVD